MIALIVVLAVLVLVYPFKFKVALHFNVIELVGFIAVKSFGLNIISMKILIDENGKLDIEIGKRKKKKKKKPFSYSQAYFMSLARRLEVKKFELYLSYGQASDAYLTSMACGVVLMIDSMLSSILLDNYKHVKIFTDIDPIYNDDRLELSGAVVVTFSIFDTAISILLGFINYLKTKKEAKANNA
ncbi:MAG: hypothetical protein IJS74_03765 [Clostridia bacterium]|nr:hypothetical protein [Clostridia bacterium]